MMQGDQYPLGISLVYKADGTPVRDVDVEDVEITIGPLRATLSAGQLSYDSALNLWLFPVEQAQTLELWPKHYRAQARIVWPGGYVEGMDLGRVRLNESNSKEVLTV